MDKDYIKKNISLIIPCTIDASGITNSIRSNEDRLNDLKTALPIWINSDFFKNYIIIENSNYNGPIISDIISSSHNKNIVEYIKYDGQWFDRSLGKGFGWYDQIKTAMNKSNFAQESEIFVFVTGRYIIKNFEKILLNVNREMMCDIKENLTFAFSPVVVFPKTFILDYLLPEWKGIDESKGLSMEHVQSKALLRAIADGYEWELPYEAPIMDTISAIHNKPYKLYPFHDVIIKYYSYLKKFVFESKR
jgi:hypothetical protein